MKKKRHKWGIIRLFKAAIAVCVLLILCEVCLTNDIFSHKNSAQEDWNLMLVNRWNELPNNYSPELTELSNGERVDSRIYPALQAMFDDARAEGVYPIVRDGYRTTQEQQDLMAEKFQAYRSEGYSRSQAKKAAEDWVAIPGTSEHQLGSAVDINADNAKCSNDVVYAWLAENAHEYGFILRYPQGKEELTGISYEPWHYRYVGVEAAQEIYTQGVCLEEYVP